MNNTATAEKVLTISTEELAAKLKSSQAFEFWNVLTSEYYSDENIAGSRHVPLDQIGREVAAKNLPKGTEIVVYCSGPECPQSTAAFEKLRTLGYSNVWAYKGGLEEWEAAGFQIVPDRDIPDVKSEAKAEGASCH